MALSSRGYTPTIFLLISLILLQLSTGSPITPIRRHIAQDLPSLARRQDGGFFSVLGVAGVGGDSSYPRLEIRELEKNTDQWNLYLLSLRRLQNVAQSDKLSYYQVAGIHGRPYIPWDGVNQGPPGSGGGYCPHSANIFPTWHRPYLALIEELLWLNARQSISEFPNGPLKDRYTEALKTFRMPYWDWAVAPPAGQGPMPWSVQRPMIEVVLPNGTATISNPLFAYRFHPLNPTDLPDPPFSHWNTTLRDPGSTSGNAASRDDVVSLKIESNRLNLQSKVFNLLALEQQYLRISSDVQSGGSLEAIHNDVHTMLGGNEGHMSNPAYAAYDPIFWLHHTNVDRLFAIWQALNPNDYVQGQTNQFATFTTPGGSYIDANSPLAPFHATDAGDFWTSETVRSTRTFGYTYPELDGLPINDTSVLVSRVNALYGARANPQKRSGSSVSYLHVVVDKRDIAGAPNFAGQRKYSLNVQVDKKRLEGSINVYVFLGKDNEQHSDMGSSTDWVKTNSFVGVAGILSLGTPQMGAERAGASVEAHGEVPLTAALEAKVRSGELASMREDVVASYLRDNLRWRIAGTDSEEVKMDDVPGMQISVVWVEMRPARSESEFPKVVGEYKVLEGATEGRTGGSR